MGRLCTAVSRVAAVLAVALPTVVVAADRLELAVDKTTVLELDRPAAVVSVANPNVADVSVQSPTVIIVTGRSMGTTSLDLLDGRKNRIRAYEVVVVPDTTDQVTINHGADGVKTLACQPRCIRVGNPGKDPEPGKGSGGGGAGGKGGVLSQVGAAVKGSAK